MAISAPARPMPATETRTGYSAAPLTRPPRAFFGSVAFIVTLLLLALLSQAKTQVLDRDKITDKANAVWMISGKTKSEPARGTIYSADQRILAQTVPKYDFWVFYDKVPRTPGFFMALAEAAGISESRISAPFGSGKKRVWLQPLRSEEYARVMAVKQKWGADGVSLEKLNERTYPLGSAAVGVVGWSREGVAKSGVESALDSELSGQSAPNKVGEDVVLTIDSQLQNVVATAIRKAVERNVATSGSAIVLSVQTGDVLAMADWPALDPAVGPTGGSELATSVAEDLQPGSTFKTLTLAKAMDEGMVGADWTIECKGVYDLGRGRTVKCDQHNGSRAHGVIGLDKAIGKSCNVSAALWALKIGREDMISYLKDLGLLSKPDIGLRGVASPLFDINEWDKERQLATLGFGQSLAVPPISLASALAMLGNDGVYLRPRLIERIGDVRQPYAPPKKVVSPESARAVRKLMESVVQQEWGTGYTLRVPGVPIAGKTGTAQKLGSGGGNVSSFVGMFPADAPTVLVLVMVNDPRGGEFYGSLVAGPAFKEIAYAAIERLGVKRTFVEEKAEE